MVSRFMRGSAVKVPMKLVTLTTPPSFSGDVHEAFRNWVKRMRRRGLVYDYFAVKEWNEAGNLQHIHCVVRCSYADYLVMREHWKVLTGAVWIEVERVYGVRGMCGYLGKYLAKSRYLKVTGRRFWYAYSWLFKGFISWGARYYRYGLCALCRDGFLRLRAMSAVERGACLYGLLEAAKRESLVRFIAWLLYRAPREDWVELIPPVWSVWLRRMNERKEVRVGRFLSDAWGNGVSAAS